MKEETDSTFFQLGPELSYDILHQEGAALAVASDMVFGCLLTEREGCESDAVKLSGLFCSAVSQAHVCVCVCVRLLREHTPSSVCPTI